MSSFAAASLTTTTTTTIFQKKKQRIFFFSNNHSLSLSLLPRGFQTTYINQRIQNDDDDGSVIDGSHRPRFCSTSTPTPTPTPKPNSNSNSNNKLLTKLRRYGISGILSYGLLNTVYYLTTFLFVWFYITPAPGRLGYAAAVERFLKVMAMVWVGSQVTKLVRAAGALALAPLVSRRLIWFTEKFKFESEGKAFMAIVGVCFGLALLLFFWVTLFWA
ncbi:hypothetical protein AQUCO_00900019v1 [Aquilegia coerulea]|uniref:Uncharacterized protein n=1 Tax=Aquilegia coerulea TaxID=218851 RepID=A0A2G5EBG1_AQUCA|nr:hypothetical protein AQUCO_00900019v1 [Aquilegia coerulea]